MVCDFCGLNPTFLGAQPAARFPHELLSRALLPAIRIQFSVRERWFDLAHGCRTTNNITGSAAIAAIARRASQARQFSALAAFCKNNQLDQRMSRAFLIVAALCAFRSTFGSVIFRDWSTADALALFLAHSGQTPAMLSPIIATRTDHRLPAQ